MRIEAIIRVKTDIQVQTDIHGKMDIRSKSDPKVTIVCSHGTLQQQTYIETPGCKKHVAAVPRAGLSKIMLPHVQGMVKQCGKKANGAGGAQGRNLSTEAEGKRDR